MEIDLKKANANELYCYKIALLQVIINCNNQIAKIDSKLVKEKKESK